MKIELMDSSKRLAEQPQQQWLNSSAPGSHTALFAGNDMSLQHEHDGAFTFTTLVTPRTTSRAPRLRRKPHRSLPVEFWCD
ncbi:hypothetical protein Bsp3421_000094 (plasmid) [Burkholderia sp. FERM BP-3421]|uniref:hypothetical protein n=1 Tax=Burkholderia sp. FERM BP-3421 TaxID=1494466 RepID=UPI002360EDD1|nr:hypothetical protein [Burkholderia sp. FERM BP-3421]WDD90271.1 hypothetical protein Bsp3421_000094 [Burkholderia sp. FERM BP-3421]